MGVHGQLFSGDLARSGASWFVATGWPDKWNSNWEICLSQNWGTRRGLVIKNHQTRGSSRCDSGGKASSPHSRLFSVRHRRSQIHKHSLFERSVWKGRVASQIFELATCRTLMPTNQKRRTATSPEVEKSLPRHGFVLAADTRLMGALLTKTYCHQERSKRG